MAYDQQITPEEYYSSANSANYGSYQYVSLKEIIDEILVDASDEDSYLKNTPRSKILSCAKSTIRELNYGVAKAVKSFEVTIGNDLFWVMPQDYVDYVMFCVIDENNKLQPLNISRKISLAHGYLQDSSFQLIFDSNGELIDTDANNAYSSNPYVKYDFVDNWYGGYFEMDTSILSRYGEVNIDEERGLFAFSSNLLHRNVVVIYFSDGLESERLKNESIKVHKLLIEAVKAGTYYRAIKTKRNVSQSEKNAAKNEYKTYKHKAAIHRSDIDMNEISRMANVKFKMM